MITITLNGTDRQIDTGLSVLELLRTLDMDPRGVVVELNRQIVRRPELAEVRLKQGDRLELVHFVGGG